MKTIIGIAAAGQLALATTVSAVACEDHPAGRTADISKAVTTADAPVMTPNPETGG